MAFAAAVTIKAGDQWKRALSLQDVYESDGEMRQTCSKVGGLPFETGDRSRLRPREGSPGGFLPIATKIYEDPR